MNYVGSVVPMDNPLKLLLIILFDSTSPWLIALRALYIAGIWKVLEKSGVKGWFALIPGACEYQMGRCGGREQDGRTLSVLAVLNRLIAILGYAPSMLLNSIGMPAETAGLIYEVLRLTVALAMGLVPAISAARTRQDRREVDMISNMGIKISMLIGLPCSVGLLVLARQSLDLLYNIDETRLTIAASLMRTSAISVLFLSLVQGLTGILQGLGKQNAPVINLAIGGAC